jgi:hypothetical protein
MSAFLLALLFSLGASTWVYTKLQNKTGYGNQKNALIGSGVCFVILFIVVFSLAKMLS